MKEGDVIQLRSGGAPLTIMAREYHANKGDLFDLVAMSAGGLLEVIHNVPKAAIQPYFGDRTPSARNKS